MSAVALAEVTAGTDYVGELFVVGGIVLSGVIGWITTIIVKKMREPTRIETMWGRIDALTAIIHGDPNDEAKPGLVTRLDRAERRAEAAERKVGVMGRVMRDLARQWPMQHVPRLNPSDLDELDEDTVPTHWRVKP